MNNITIRPANAANAPACAYIHIRSWIYAYTGLIPDEIISEHNAKRSSLWQKMLSGENNSHFVATLVDKVIGIITLNPPRDTDLPSGTYELTGLYLDPDYIGHGYGGQIMNWIKENVKAMGYERISLWVLEGNIRARRFYEKYGFFADGTSKSSGLADTIEVRYITEMNKSDCNVIQHYDALIDENNDPVHDPQLLKDYMDKWDGQAFINELQLSKDKTVLEIGVGTGRLAVKVAPQCGSFTGIDISPKTIERARENLGEIINITLICDDFMTHRFDGQFDLIYSSLTFMHISDKLTAINKVAGLLAPGGRFVLSISKNQNEYIDFDSRKIKVFPDNPNDICGYIKDSQLKLEKQFETEFAVIFAARKIDAI